jgi:hypothetical protein
MNRLHTLGSAGLILLLFAVSGCTDIASGNVSFPSAQPLAETTNGTVEKVEVYHFHRDQECASCIAVGELAEKTVNANFRNELASGRLVFAHVNAEQPENAALAAKYEVTGSSLWIGVYDANGFHKEQDLNVWYLIDDTEAYSTYLSAVLSKRLNGELS